MSSIELNWQDPPSGASPSTRGHQWAEVTAALRGHPKRWLLLKTYPKATTAATAKYRAKHGGVAAFRPAEDWEFLVSGCDLYVRYIGS
jgi:hypothetical protein